MTTPWDVLRRERFLPVLTVDHADVADALGDALVAGGCGIVEVVLRSAAAHQVVRRLAARGDLIVAAGTVVDPEEVDRVADLGARLVVRPGFSPAVVERCLALGIPVLPGASGATDVMAARAAGLRAVKLFPADLLGGPALVSALAAPFPGMTFVPSGGVDLASAPTYARLETVLAVSGSWVAPRQTLAKGDVSDVAGRVQAALSVVARRGAPT